MSGSDDTEVIYIAYIDRFDRVRVEEWGVRAEVDSMGKPVFTPDERIDPPQQPMLGFGPSIGFASEIDASWVDGEYSCIASTVSGALVSLSRKLGRRIDEMPEYQSYWARRVESLSDEISLAARKMESIMLDYNQALRHRNSVLRAIGAAERGDQ